MSKKTTTTNDSTNKYDPQAMQAYHSLLGQVTPFLKTWLGNADPTQTQGFNLLMQNGLRNADALGGRNIRTLTSNALALGQNPNSGMFSSQLARATRANSGLQQNAFLNSVGNAMDMQRYAAGVASAFQPLQTGSSSTQVQKTGGVGSWLPQVAGMGLSAAMPFMGGGLGSIMGATSSLGSAPTNMTAMTGLGNSIWNPMTLGR